MTKEKGVMVVLGFLVLNGCLDTYLTLHNKSGIAQRTEETRKLAVENRERARENRAIALANCHAIATVASVERRFIGRTEAQSQAFLKSGATFGLSPDQLAKAIAASRASQALFLHELDALKATTCAAPGASTPSIATPGKAQPRPKGSPATPTAAPASGVTGSAGASFTPSPRTLPDRRRTSPRPTLSPALTAPASTSSSPPTPSARQSPIGPPPPPSGVPTEPAHGLTVPTLPCVKTPVLSVC